MATDDNNSSGYEDRLERVRSEAANGLRVATGDLLAQLHVCARYFNRGTQEGFDYGELIDYLGISTPSVLDQAGYSDEDGLRVMEGLVLLVQDKTGITQAPNELPNRALETHES
jgi:hypothetical protein